MPFPTLKMGPGDCARSHTADEYIYIDEIKEGIELYIQLLNQMTMKLWQKDKASLKEVEKFTVGKDRELDMYLAAFDVLGSIGSCYNAGISWLADKRRITQLQ